jgi:hypothetical protein
VDGLDVRYQNDFNHKPSSWFDHRRAIGWVLFHAESERRSSYSIGTIPNVDQGIEEGKGR